MPSLHFIGSITSITLAPSSWLSAPFSSSPSLFCRWSIITGGGGEYSESLSAANWRVLDGEASGKSLLVDEDTINGKYYFNETFDLSLACASLTGWPALLIQVFSKDSFDRVDLVGYAVRRLPMAPGQRNIRSTICRPRGTFKENFIGDFIGGRPRYEAVNVLISGDSRYGHPTVSVGVLDWEITMIHRGFQKNIKFNTEEVGPGFDGGPCVECHGQPRPQPVPVAPQAGQSAVPALGEAAGTAGEGHEESQPVETEEEREARLLLKAAAIHEQVQKEHAAALAS